MNEERASDWRFLLPAESAYTLVGGAPKQLAKLSKPYGYSVLVAADVESRLYPDLSQFQAVVAINPARDTGQNLLMSGFAVQHRFAVVPSLINARWFVPVESSQAAKSMLQTYTPQKRSAKAVHAVARAGARLGMLGWYRDRVLVATRQLSVVDRVVLEATGKQGLLGISTGTVGLARKPMGVALDPDGTQFAFVRIADTDAGRERIEREAEMLKALETLPSPVQAPSLLMCGERDGWFFSVQTPLPGPTPSNAWTPRHDQFLSSLKHGVTCPALETPLLQELRQFALLAGEDSIFEAAWRSIAGLMEEQIVEMTVVHGDFAPWNLRETPDGIAAFDWEYGVVGGIPRIDEKQYRFLLRMLVNNWSIDRVWVEVQADTARDPSSLAQWLVCLAVGAKHRAELGFDESDYLTGAYHELLRRGLQRGSIA